MIETLLTLDGEILLWLQTFVRSVFLTPAVRIYTQLGNMGLLWIVLSLGMLLFKKTRKAGFVSLLAMSLGLLCTNVVLKHLVARPRPWLTVEGLVHLVIENDPNSFPSGHTCAAFAAAGAWVRALPKRWMGVAGIVMAALMGLSRLYVGVHFPSDVLAGMVIGLLCAWAAWSILKWAEKRRGETGLI